MLYQLEKGNWLVRVAWLLECGQLTLSGMLSSLMIKAFHLPNPSEPHLINFVHKSLNKADSIIKYTQLNFCFLKACSIIFPEEKTQGLLLSRLPGSLSTG